MQRFLCSVNLNGSTQHVVTNKRVTVPEIALLQRIHGADAVKITAPITPLEDYDPAEERARLRKAYDNALPGDEDGSTVDRMFNPLRPLPTTLAGIGIDPKAEAKRLREAAQAAADAAARIEEGAAELEDEEDEDALLGLK